LRGDKVVTLTFAERIKWLSGGRLDVAGPVQKIDVKGGEMENAFRHWMMWKLGHLVSRVSSPIS